MKFADFVRLRAHLRITHGAVMGRDTKYHKCTLCPRKYLQPNLLKKHMLTHTDPRSFACEHCKLVFTQSTSLRKHERRAHPYKCDLCQHVSFSRGMDLIAHHQSHHSSANLCQCDWCDEEFSNVYAFRAHVRTHAAKSETTLAHRATLSKRTDASQVGTPFKCEVSLDEEDELRAVKQEVMEAG